MEWNAMNLEHPARSTSTSPPSALPNHLQLGQLPSPFLDLIWVDLQQHEKHLFNPQLGITR